MARLMKMSLGITFIALIVGYVAALDEGLLTVSRCKDKGFAPGATACSVCSKLEDVLTASGSSDAGSIVSDCLSCCSPAIDAVSPTKFQAAHLTVCRYSLQNHGGVNEFLEKSSFKDVITVNDVMGKLIARVSRILVLFMPTLAINSRLFHTHS